MRTRAALRSTESTVKWWRCRWPGACRSCRVCSSRWSASYARAGGRSTRPTGSCSSVSWPTTRTEPWSTPSKFETAPRRRSTSWPPRRPSRLSTATCKWARCAGPGRRKYRATRPFIAAHCSLLWARWATCITTRYCAPCARRGPRGYSIPRGGLFEFVSGANYLCEMLEWAGFAIAGRNRAAHIFWACVVFNLGPRAVSHHA